MIQRLFCLVIALSMLVPLRGQEQDIRLQIQRQQDFSFLKISPTGRYLLSAPSNDKLTLWDANSLRQIVELPCRQSVPGQDDFQIDEENRVVACLCEENYATELRFFDFNGKLLKRIAPESGSILGFSLSKELLVLESYDVDGLLFNNFELDSVGSIPERLSQVHLSDSSDIIIGLKGKDTLKVFDHSSGALIRSILLHPESSFVSSIATDFKSRKVAIVYGAEGSVFDGTAHSRWEVLEMGSGKVQLQGKLGFGLDDVVFDPSGEYLYHIDYSDSLDEQGYSLQALMRYQLSTGKREAVFSYPAGVISGNRKLVSHPQKPLLYFSHNNSIQVYSTRYHAWVRRGPVAVKEEYTQLTEYDQGRMALIRTGSAVHVVDKASISNYNLLDFDTSFLDGGLLFLPGKSFILASAPSLYWEEGNKYRVAYNLSDQSTGEIRMLQLENEVIVESKWVDELTLALITYSDEAYSLCLWDPERRIYARYKIDQKKQSYGHGTFEVSSDGQALIGINIKDKGKATKQILQLSLDNKIKEINRYERAFRAIFMDGKVVIQRKVEGNEWNSEPYEFIAYQDGVSQALGTTKAYSGELVFDKVHDRLMYIAGQEVTGYSQGGETIHFSTEGRYVLNASTTTAGYCLVGYNTLDYYQEETSVSFTFVASQEEGLIGLLPNKYYAVFSYQHPRQLQYIYESEAYAFDQFDLYFNRPFEVLSHLGYAEESDIQVYALARAKRLKRLGIDGDVLSFKNLSSGPEIKVEWDNIPAVTHEKTIDIPFWVTASDAPVTNIEVAVNYVPEHDTSGVPLSMTSGMLVTQTTLSSGLNKIEISCSDSLGNQSLRSSYEVTYIPEKASKPDLYLIVLSVSDYRDDRYDLNYAAKDGRDLVDVFQAQSGHYNQIHYDTFFNQSVTRDKLDSIAQRLGHCKVEDQVVIFLSGHGLLDRDNEFYFAGYDMDFDDPRARGLSYRRLEEMLELVSARQKLLMIDACHSGEVDPGSLVDKGLDTSEGLRSSWADKGAIEVNSNEQSLGLDNSFVLMQEVFTDLNRGSGAVVISAAAGDSYALESAQWQNGVFTYALKEGLVLGYADLNKDGIIRIQELKEYVFRRVKQETDGRQIPTSRRDNIGHDYILFR